MAGTVDVEAMLDSMTCEQFAMWCAKDRIEPIGAATTLLARLIADVEQYMSGKTVDPASVLPVLKFYRKPGQDSTAAESMLATQAKRQRQERRSL